MDSFEPKTKRFAFAKRAYLAILLTAVVIMIRSYELRISRRRLNYSYLHIPTQFLPPIAITAPPLYSRID